MAKIKSIEIQIGTATFKFSLREARELYKSLGEIFEKETIHVPYQQQYYPWSYPWSSGATTITTTGANTSDDSVKLTDTTGAY